MVNQLFIVIGFISLALGIIGVFVPLLPTTPFVLLTAALFFRSSPRFYNWLIKNRWFGKHLENYQKRRGISVFVKIYAIIILWGSIISTVLFLQNHILVDVFLLFIAVAVSIHLLMLRSVRR